MGQFVTIKTGADGSHEFAPAGAKNQNQSISFMQFVPGHVIKCLTNGDDRDFNNMGGIIGAV